MGRFISLWISGIKLKIDKISNYPSYETQNFISLFIINKEFESSSKKIKLGLGQIKTLPDHVCC